MRERDKARADAAEVRLLLDHTRTSIEQLLDRLDALAERLEVVTEETIEP